MPIFTDVFDDVTKQARKLQTTEYQSDGKYIIVDQGQNKIAGYTNEAEGVFTDVPAIVFGDHTRVIKYVDKPCFLGADGVKLLKAKIQNPNYRYLYYALSHAEIPNTGYNRHFKWLKEVDIRLPDAKTQVQIVEVLDRVSKLIFEHHQQLSKLDELVKSRFIELFGDLADPMCSHPQCRLVEACAVPDDIKCGPFGTQLSKDEYQESGVAVWEIPHINSGFTIQPTHFLTPKKAKELGAYTLEPGDIAMSRKGNVGKCGLYPAGYEIGIIHSDVLRIRVDHQRVHPCFMMHQLHYSGTIQRQIEMVSSGAIMAGINVTKLKQIMVHIPDYGLQHEFVTFVEQTDKLKFEVKNSLEKLETLKKSLMHEYFG